jgi:hypothetical protein
MILDDLGTYLQAQGVGTLGTTLFKGTIPADDATGVQHALVALVETPAGLPGVHAHTYQEATYHQPVIQIVARGEPYGYQAARQKAEQVFVALDGLHNAVLGEHYYLWILAVRPPYPLRIDELHRPLIATDVRCALRPV